MMKNMSNFRPDRQALKTHVEHVSTWRTLRSDTQDFEARVKDSDDDSEINLKSD